MTEDIDRLHPRRSRTLAARSREEWAAIIDEARAHEASLLWGAIIDDLDIELARVESKLVNVSTPIDEVRAAQGAVSAIEHAKLVLVHVRRRAAAALRGSDDAEQRKRD